MKKFIPGMELSRSFYGEIVKPLVKQEFPGLAYTAGLIDYRSDVLGFDCHRPLVLGDGPA